MILIDGRKRPTHRVTGNHRRHHRHDDDLSGDGQVAVNADGEAAEQRSSFIAARRRNFQALREGLRELEEFFILPEATPGAEPSWFGFPLAIRPDAPFTRNEVTRLLEERKIATRLLFGGNLTRQPAYQDSQYRIAGQLKNTDFVMNQVFWIGLYPGITPEILDYMLESLHAVASMAVQVGV